MKVAVLEDEVCSMLIRNGISQNLKGYLYLKEAVMLAVRNPEITFELTKVLYPRVAEKYDTTAKCVERSMRHAIDKSWKESLEYGLELTLVFSRKPTNGNFIRSLATTILKEGSLSCSLGNSVWLNRFQRC